MVVGRTKGKIIRRSEIILIPFFSCDVNLAEVEHRYICLRVETVFLNL